MSWNDGYERKMFAKRQKKQAEEYRALGMTEEQIQAMYEFDLEQFKSERRHRVHTQPLQVEEFEENDVDESDNTLLNEFFDELTCTIETSGDKSRYWWVEEIDNPNLVRAIKGLSMEQIELLTLVVIDGYGQTEIAEILNVSQSAISQRLATIKKILKTTL